MQLTKAIRIPLVMLCMASGAASQVTMGWGEEPQLTLDLAQVMSADTDPVYLCEHVDVKLRMFRDRVVVLKYAEDVMAPGQVSKTDIEFGCDLTSGGGNEDYGYYSGRCKLSQPPPNCPTCTWNLASLEYATFGDRMIVLGTGSHSSFSGLYQICHRDP